MDGGWEERKSRPEGGTACTVINPKNQRDGDMTKVLFSSLISIAKLQVFGRMGSNDSK